MTKGANTSSLKQKLLSLFYQLQMYSTMKNPSKPYLWIIYLCIFLTYTNCHAQSNVAIPDEWLILGPIPVSSGQEGYVNEEKQMEAFNTNYLDPAVLEKVKEGQDITIDGKSYFWKKEKANGDIVNVDAIYDSVDFASAYGWVEFKSDKDQDVLLGVGSDDGIKIWLNGELAHENWVPRGVNLDDDLVPVSLKKGTNRLLLKVQDMSMGWGFACRIFLQEDYPDKLVEAAGEGEMEMVNLLLSRGVDINAENAVGLTALNLAKIQGREDIVDQLIEKGADPAIPIPPKEQMADYYFQDMIGKNEPGAAILVTKDGQVIYKKGFGLANIEEGIPITPETEFRIGSITKQFTAAAILKLVEDEKIDLDDPLSKFIPDYPRGEEVTIHHLLTHTSGIKSYTDKMNFQEDIELTKPISSEEDHIESFKYDTFNFDPGTSWSYNNSGYFLLGYIIGQVSGKSYGDYLHEQYFKPIGMDHTGLHHLDVKLDHEATGYGFEDGKASVAPNWEMTWAGGAGAMYSTVDDLFKWNEALFNGKVLNDESLKVAFTPVVLNNGKEAMPKYGYGWMIGELRGWEDISHGGGLPGFITFLTRFPEHNVTVAILTNAAPQNKMNPQQASYDLTEIFFWEDMDKLPTKIVDENADVTAYKDYVGRYEYMQGMILTVSTEDKHLYAQLTGQQRFEIFPEGNDKFFWKVVDAQVEFVRDEAGKVTHVVHTQGGQSFEAPLIEEEEPVVINSDILDHYVGIYDLNGRNVNVTKENDQLWVQVTGQPKFHLLPRSESEFFLKEVVASFTFVKNGSGEYDKIILVQGGNTLDLMRKE